MGRSRTFEIILGIMVVLGAGSLGLTAYGGADHFQTRWMLSSLVSKSFLESQGVKRVSVYPSYLSARKTLKLEGQEFLKLKFEASADAPQCFLKNQGDALATISAGKRLDVVSLIGSAHDPRVRSDRFSNWEFALPQAGLSMYCEFPTGALKGQIHREIKRALAGQFEFHAARPMYLNVEEIPSKVAVNSPGL